MSVCRVTGAREPGGPLYVREYEEWSGGPWYYRVGKTPTEATRTMLRAIAPTARGPLDWPDKDDVLWQILRKYEPGLRDFVMTGEWTAS